MSKELEAELKPLFFRLKKKVQKRVDYGLKQVVGAQDSELVFGYLQHLLKSWPLPKQFRHANLQAEHSSGSISRVSLELADVVCQHGKPCSVTPRVSIGSFDTGPVVVGLPRDIFPTKTYSIQ